MPLIIGIAIVIRLASAWGAYLTVIRRMVEERKDLSGGLKAYNLKLIISVSTFIVTCIGTSIFQACRIDWLPYCSGEYTLDLLALFNSFGLLSAYVVMHLLVNATDKVRVDAVNKDMREIKTDVKEVKKDVKIVKGKL